MPKHLSICGLLAIAATPALQAGAPLFGVPDLKGVVVYADNWGYNARTGIYALPNASSGDFQMLIEGPNGASVVVQDRIYTINRVTMPELDIDYPRYTIYDAESGNELYFENIYSADWSLMPVDMDVDPLTGEVYAITYNSDMSGYQLSRMEFVSNGVYSHKIADLTGNWNAMAFDAAGQIYAVSKQNRKEGSAWTCSSSSLEKIDRTTGERTTIGETGLLPEYMTSATIDKVSGRMFWTVAPADGSGLLAEINLATGLATVLCTFDHSEEVVGLYSPSVPADIQAPGQAAGLELNFPGTSLSGTLSFTAPTSLYDGSTPAQRDLEYSVALNDEPLLTGATQYGERVSLDVTVPSRGEWRFNVTMSNQYGESLPATVRAFVGPGTPQAPHLYLTDTGSEVSLQWTLPEESADGGYLNPQEVVYTLHRYPEGICLIQNGSQTTFSEALAEPDDFTHYWYGLTATYAGLVSPETFSGHVALGQIHPPYFEPFDEETSIAGWKIVDANSDHRTWMWSTLQNLRISFNMNQDMDDWAITPPFFLEAGKSYPIAFDVCGDDAATLERIEVKLGTAQSAEAMRADVVDPVEISCNRNDPMTVRGMIEVERTGTYWLGFHCISPADQLMLNLDNIRVDLEESSVRRIDAPGLSVRVAGRVLSVANPDGQRVGVFSAEGVRIHSATGDTSVNLPAGVYLVKAGACIRKVSVR